MFIFEGYQGACPFRPRVNTHSFPFNLWSYQHIKQDSLNPKNSDLPAMSSLNPSDSKREANQHNSEF